MRIYEELREEMLKKEQNEMAKSIILSYWQWTPKWEEKYICYIKTNKYLFGLYKTWVLSFNPIYPISAVADKKDTTGKPIEKDYNLFKLREVILDPLRDKEEIDFRKINKPVFFFLYDLAYPFLESKIRKNLTYWRILKIPPKENELQKTVKEIEKVIEISLIKSLLFSEKAQVIKEGYNDFLTAIIDKFGYYLFSTLKIKHLDLFEIEKDEEFVEKFEIEWEWLCCFPDSFYGFDVTPLIHQKDFFRYLELPFKNKRFSNLKKEKIYKQVNNYIVFLAFVKPMPHEKLTPFFYQKLLELYNPLIDYYIKKYERKWEKERSVDYKTALSEESKKEMLDWLIKGVKVNEFNPFYKSIEEMKKNPNCLNSFAPMSKNGGLAKLGNISDLGEYPFTAYFKENLKKFVRSSGILRRESERPSVSLEKVSKEGKITGEEKFGNIPKEMFQEDSYKLKSVEGLKEIIEGDANALPGYDFKDFKGKELGWFRNTFAGIIGINKDTLINWHKKNKLNAKRYLRYRYYTLEQLDKARKLKAIGAKYNPRKIR
jgi:hypothetical protein